MISRWLLALVMVFSLWMPSLRTQALGMVMSGAVESVDVVVFADLPDVQSEGRVALPDPALAASDDTELDEAVVDSPAIAEVRIAVIFPSAAGPWIERFRRADIPTPFIEGPQRPPRGESFIA